MLEDPCPYCHAPDALSIEVTTNQYVVSCNNCFARGPLQPSQELALSL